MISYPIPQKALDEEVARARYLLKNNPGLARGNKTGLRGAIIGCLGERAAKHFFRQHEVPYTDLNEARSNMMWGQDFQLHFDRRSTRVEVKGKERTVPPIPKYAAGFFASSAHQEPEYYLFVQLQCTKRGLLDYHTAWILGFIDYERFHNLAEFKPKDSVLNEAGVKAVDDTLDVTIADLEDPDATINGWKRHDPEWIAAYEQRELELYK